MAKLGDIKGEDDPALTNQVLPAGVMFPYAGNAAPSAGWLLCEGQAVSRTTYAALFAVIGTTYGEGDKATTFNVPDMRGRVPVGADNMGGGAGAAGRVTANNTRGASAGEQTHALSEAEMPSHTHVATDSGHVHGVTDPGHNHTERTGSRFLIANAGSDGTDAPKSPGGGSESSLETATKTTGVTVNSSTAKVTNAAKGGGTAHNNLQPYQVHQWIVKT